ncbi:MAG: rod shape-determining protein MreC [Paenibacillus sp. RIFOXYA1_FULL_44_5]|nr:MAG: rod shape-determining protein MreC [Paenibacillus sp. RIFOXYA1_FULL_44_5]
MLSLIIFSTIMGLSFGKYKSLNWPEKMVKDYVSLAQGWINKPAQFIAGLFENIHSITVVYKENQILKHTLMQYARDTVKLNGLELENSRLEAALHFTDNQKAMNEYRFHIARVIALSPDPYNHVAVINLGAKDGIQPDMVVMTVDGLAGRVTAVSEFSANVQLITDISDRNTNSKWISATVKGKPSSFGIIDNFDAVNGLLVMTKIPQDDPLEVGDTVVTSSLGQVFPAGVPIGKVVSRKEGDFGITHTAYIKPFADFQQLQEVFVIEVPGAR